MLVTTHALTGALLGSRLPGPVPAFVAGVLSHAALDVLPHWGVVGRETDPAVERLFFRVAAVDGLTMLGVAALLARPSADRVRVLAGLAGAVLPDMDKPTSYLGVQLFPVVVDHWHGRIQTQERPWRWPVDVVTGLLAAGLLARRVSR